MEETILYDLYKLLKEDMEKIKIENQKLNEEIKCLKMYVDTTFRAEERNLYNIRESIILRVRDDMEQKYHLMKRN